MTPDEASKTFTQNGVIPLLKQRPSDPSRLAPEDAHSPPRRERGGSPLGLGANGSVIAGTEVKRSRKRNGSRGRSGSRRRNRGWKKLLWVKQSYPDNYTDEYTFLDHLQRNPRLQPYQFWHLVADSTVIVQHVSTVAIFVSCFTGIFQDRVSPVTVVTWGTLATIIGWVVWDFWVGQEAEARLEAEGSEVALNGEEDFSASSSTMSMSTHGSKQVSGAATPSGRLQISRSSNALFAQSTAEASMATPTGHPTGAPTFANYTPQPLYGMQKAPLSPRTQQRLATAKSAILIYCAVLGLSPILKSLTKSTSSDSIWAISAWLFVINVSFFDYGGGVSAKFPASLSTNAALMASTVLASRLTSTTHVFSLTLFSIQVFGLFPIFRRHLRHVSWRAHIILTVILVFGASAGVGIIVSGGGWSAAIVGCFLGSILTMLVMGICSWWLIDLQKYKNEIHGPWDPARPVIRRRWD